MEKEKIKIEIKNRWTGAVLFEYEKEDNTIKETVIEAVNNGADLGCADLRDANLGCADLGCANLGCADLRGADLRCADLRGADLGDAENIPFIPMTCPSDGSFIGWKKVWDGDYTFLIKLLIPEDAKRSSSTGRKCRCSEAIVLKIIDLDDEERKVEACTNHSYGQITEYKVGGKVVPDSFDDNRWKECSHGIHFFINKQEAIDYDV